MGSPTYYNVLVYHCRKRKVVRTMVIYAVWIEKDTNEYDYVRERKNNSWNDESPVLLFDTKEAAQEEANTWNTGEVVEYVYNE